jgi:hypothetical protein
MGVTSTVTGLTIYTACCFSPFTSRTIVYLTAYSEMLCTSADTVVAVERTVLILWILVITAFRDLSLSITFCTMNPGMNLTYTWGIGAVSTVLAVVSC